MTYVGGECSLKVFSREKKLMFRLGRDLRQEGESDSAVTTDSSFLVSIELIFKRLFCNTSD